MQQEQRRHATSAALTIYSENQFECNTNAINKLSLWHSHTHTHIHTYECVTSVNMSNTHTHAHMHTHLQHALCVCASCAVFNFLWPTASITINITQTRHALCPPPRPASPSLLSALPPLSPSVMLCSLSRMKNAIRIDIDANEKCQLFSRVAKESKLETVRTWIWIRIRIWVLHSTKKGREKESERDKEWERQRTIADVVNFELVQLQFLRPRLTFVCSSLNEPEIEVASSNKSAKYSPEHKKQAAAAINKIEKK